VIKRLSLLDSSMTDDLRDMFLAEINIMRCVFVAVVVCCVLCLLFTFCS